MKFSNDTKKVIKESLMNMVESQSLKFRGLKTDFVKAVACQYAEACINRKFVSLNDTIDLCAILRVVSRETDRKIEASFVVASFLHDFIEEHYDIINNTEGQTRGCVDIW